MEEEQKRWEKRSARIVLGLRKGILVYGILVMALLFLYNVGFEQDVDGTLQAFVITEDGDGFSCELSLSGEVTDQPLKNLLRRGAGYADSGSITVQLNGKRLGIVEFHGTDPHYSYGTDHAAVCVFRRDRQVFLASTDAQRFFPELESQNCVIIAPAADAQQARQILQEQTISEAYQPHFLWVLEK